MYPVKFKTIPVQRLWGGHQLKQQFGVERAEPIGEYWLISGHPTATSVVDNGELRGKTLIELTKEYPTEFLGDSPQPRFPLLIKILEAEQDLSVQVHPDDAYANAHENDFGKTEAWYVLDCKPDGKVNYGHRFANRDEYMQAVREKKVEFYLEYLPIHKEDVVFVPARTLHALLAGTMVLEVQQTSDVTYRVYDWDRVDENGRGRDLHVDKARDVLDYAGSRHLTKSPVKEVLVDEGPAVLERLLVCAYFTLDRLSLCETALGVTSGRAGNPDAWMILEGEGELKFGQDNRLPLHAGDAVLVPASLRGYELSSKTKLTALRAFY